MLGCNGCRQPAGLEAFSLAAITAPAASLSSFKAKEGDSQIAFEDSVCLKSSWAVIFARISTPPALTDSFSLEEGCVSPVKHKLGGRRHH